MKYVKNLVRGLIGGILGFLLIGLGYNLTFGRPITLNQYYSNHDISYMKIIYNNNENALNEEKLTKELTNEEIDHFLKQFGSYKIFKPFFRRSFIAKQDKYNIGIHLKNEQGDFAVMFPLTDLGEVNLFRHTFYPYRAQHKDMYDYLLNLLSP